MSDRKRQYPLRPGIVLTTLGLLFLSPLIRGLTQEDNHAGTLIGITIGVSFLVVGIPKLLRAIWPKKPDCHKRALSETTITNPLEMTAAREALEIPTRSLSTLDNTSAPSESTPCNQLDHLTSKDKRSHKTARDSGKEFLVFFLLPIVLFLAWVSVATLTGCSGFEPCPHKTGKLTSFVGSVALFSFLLWPIGVVVLIARGLSHKEE